MASSLFAVKSPGSDNPRFEVLDTSGAITVLVDNVQVLAERQATIATATDTTTAITSVNSVIAALQAHGLIA